MSCNETCATIVTWRWRSVENRGRSLRIVCTGDMNFPAASGLMPRFCWRCMPLARKQLLQTGQDEILTWQRICKRSSAVSNHKSYWVHAFQRHQLLCICLILCIYLPNIFAEYVSLYIVMCGVIINCYNMCLVKCRYWFQMSSVGWMRSRTSD